MKGRIVRVSGPEFAKSFDVAIEDHDAAIAAVRVAHPGLDGYHLEAEESLSPTAVAYLELDPGGVRERLSLEPSRDVRNGSNV